ncbi:di-heme enzyme [Ketobacter sp. MCCC 1A13808]|uniref:methanobactin export MATE transporter MbnM n=1 Tax=Ketobacter sp. MCCC 1A13808 TaxID=2602738 RepID=UPI0012EBFA26|nr:methanobactin export MATE transporter MbnM [Ketobacter sp. MCCC 1A13808]MVF12310.1 di-heme enzyme [Ketobacter sp. MCCC 1A13808]
MNESSLSQRGVQAALLCLPVILIQGCGGSSSTQINDGGIHQSAFEWRVRADVPLPVEPERNPITEAKFQLGRHLFFDARLSGNGSQSCGSCHHQDKAFSDGLVVAEGSTGQAHPRNSQTLTNVAYNATYTWANPALISIESQMQVPLFSEDPVEQGINDSNRDEVLQRIIDEPLYAGLFAEAFPDQGSPIDFPNIVNAIGSFVRGLISFGSAFDQFAQGDQNAISASAKRGQTLFFSETTECFHCHGGYNFSDSNVDRTIAFVERPFHNTGLFNIGGNGDYPADNQGAFEVTGDPADMGQFRAPTLRNIELTAPYMHDGSIATLEDVVAFYAAGGRNIASGPLAGDGRANPFKDSFVKGFTLTDQEKADLIAFLKTLTDTDFVTNERFSDPWTTP